MWRGRRRGCQVRGRDKRGRPCLIWPRPWRGLVAFQDVDGLHAVTGDDVLRYRDRLVVLPGPADADDFRTASTAGTWSRIVSSLDGRQARWNSIHEMGPCPASSSRHSQPPGPGSSLR